ncbi:MAG: phosphoribosyltransferase, partial [Bacteroidota bacterium]
NSLNMVFQDREQAALLLIPRLEKFRGKQVVVLSIPRGGVPMGCIIAKHFCWEHGLLIAKKIGHPLNPEYAIGAVGGNMVYVDEKHADVSKSYIEREVARIRASITERENRFMKGRTQPDITGKTVIVVDDGIATGLTMKLSVQMLRQRNPTRIIVAVPVAPPSSMKLVQQVADELVVLHADSDFSGVGQFYVDFSEVTDDDVVRCLDSIVPRQEMS